MRALDWWRAQPRKYKLAIMALVLYGLYGLAGYFGGSPWLRAALVDGVAEVTGREVQLDRAVFNPYGLAVTLEDFALLDPDGGDFVAFDRLYFDFELSSLFRWSIHFDDFELARPRVRVTREDSGAFNFDDLLALGEPASSPEAEPAAAPKILPVSVGRLALSRGEVRYRDESRGEPRTMVLDELDFQVDDFSTRSDGTDGNDYALNLTSSEGGRFRWTGNLGVKPLTLDGRLELTGLALGPLAEFYEDRLRFALPGGEVDIVTAYTLDLGGDALRYSLSDGSITLNNLRVRQPELDQDTLTVPGMTLEGIALDSAATSLEVDRLALEQPSLRVRQLEEGLNLESLVVTEASEAVPGEGDAKAAPGDAGSDTAQDPSAKRPASSPWRFRLNTLALSEADLRYSDRTLRSPGDLKLQPLNLTVEGIQWGGDGDFKYQGNTRFNDQGDIRFSGTGNLDPARVDLDLEAEGVALAPLEPWLRDSARVELNAGQMSADLQADASKLASSPEITAAGELSGEGIVVREGGDRPMLDLSAFHVAGIDFDLAGRRLGAERIDLNGLALASVIDAQGRGTAERITRTRPDKAPADPANGETTPWRIRAGEIHVRDSALSFDDRSLNPDFTFSLNRLRADLRNLDTGGDQAMPLTLTADVDRYAPLRVQGRIRPSGPFADLAITLDSYEMTSLTPYTGRFIGHKVKSGQLNLDGDMELAGTRLESSTDLRARDFYLGEKVESDQAINAPVKLGLAVLRNRAGLIRLPVTSSGDLAKPNVSVSGIIVQAITNSLVKAATSPFDLLAGLVGGEDLDTIAFPAGGAEPDEQSRKTLDAIKQALNQRPTLEMKLAGSWTRADRLALARADRIDAWGKAEWPGLETAADNPAFRRHIRQAYRNTLDKDLDGLADKVENADAEARQARKRRIAVQAFEELVQYRAGRIVDERLKNLASRRARGVRTWLVETGGIDAERLTVQARPLEGQSPITGVQVGLSIP